MTINPTRILLVALLLTCPLAAVADDRRGGEAGFVVGGILTDDEMTRDDGAVEPTFGLRGGSVFTRHIGWYVDGLYSEIDTLRARGTGRTVVGRSGIDWLFTPERDARFFVTFAAGWMVVDYENSAADDFHNPLASIGFGQRIRLAENTRLRWELRADRLLDDARLSEALNQGLALLAITWGPAGAADGQSRPVSDDDDGDGVRNGRDRCPGTPAGAVVDDRGCSTDRDRDGVVDGIDQCPGTRRGVAVGDDGCPADADGDGVGDQTDTCPATPAGAAVDEWGCPWDGDEDGVVDGLDRCPNSPRGAIVDSTGCAPDSDGDGVVDGVDRCPGTARGLPVDRYGCARDSDGDGVPDGADACPDSPPGSAVDARGCTAKAPLFEAGETALVLRGVQFEKNSDALTAASHAVLDEVADSLRANADVNVEIAGHTDATGEDAYNLGLSRRRAEAVRAYLVRRGVAAERLAARGYGETQPVADNDTRDGRAQNRRVELRKR
jgi:outer membrane protein OmpA-like peptidoglycan-associated protein